MKVSPKLTEKCLFRRLWAHFRRPLAYGSFNYSCSGSNLGSLLEYYPSHYHEDYRTCLNTVEASNRPRPTDYLKTRPTGHVNPIEDIEIIRL
jgi:hypothetical protein